MTLLLPRLSIAAIACALSLSTSPAHAAAAAPVLVPVVVSVSTNTAEIDGFAHAYLTRTLPADHNEGMFAKVNFSMLEAAPGIARDTRVFTAMLPPGEYSFSGFATGVGAGSKTLSISPNRYMGKFTVAAGAPVDLGRLVLTPVNRKVVIGRAARSPSNVAMLRRAAPEQAALFAGAPAAGAPAAGWTEPMSADAGSLEAHALSHPVGAECITETADGVVYAASRLGTVLMRPKNGRWSALHSPGLESLRCVAPSDLPDTELVAVGELSTMVRKPRGQKVLVPVDTGNLPMGDLNGIVGSAAAGWIVRHQQGDQVTLFQSSKLEGGTWTPVLTNKAGNNPMHGVSRRRTSTFLWQTPQSLGYAAHAGQVKLFDVKASQWRDVALPAGQQRIINVFAGSNGELSMLAASGNPLWVSVEKAFISRDLGTSWTAVGSPIKNFAPMVQIAHDGTLIARHLDNKTLMTSRDDGATWTNTGPLENSAATLPLRNGELLNVEDGRYGWFGIKTTIDFGANWSSEYSTFNSEAYAAEQADKAAKGDKK